MVRDFEAAIAAHYSHDPERDRLDTWGRLERLRTEELLGRYLPGPPAVIYDVGGARGAYALPLARAGYQVHLLDPWPPHVEAAAVASRAQPDAPLCSVTVGDARRLPFDDRSADAVLLFGPLYHMIEPDQRALALAETQRVLKPGGVVLAAAISRYASTFDGLRSGALADPVFEGIVIGDVRDGVHRNPDPHQHPEWFTLAYVHRPDELRTELATSGLRDIDVLAIEGAGSFGLADDHLDDPACRETVLRAIRRIETVPELLGASAHLMAIGHAP